MASAYPLFYRKVFEEGENMLDTERRLFGIDHTEVGSILAKQWDFPESLAQVIRYHHFPDKVVSGKEKELASIVHLADLLLSRFNIGVEFERMGTAALSNHLSLLEMQQADFPELVDLIPASVFQSTAEDPLSLTQNSRG